MTVNAYIKDIEISQINNLTLYFKEKDFPSLPSPFIIPKHAIICLTCILHGMTE